MLREDHYASKELKHRKKYLDMICKNFADYMEKKRSMILTSVKFHKHAIEVRALSRLNFFSSLLDIYYQSYINFKQTTIYSE